MKILHVNICAGGGGVEQYLYQLFKKMGHENFLLYGRESHLDLKFSPQEKRYVKNVAEVQGCHRTKGRIAVERILFYWNPDIVLIHQVLNAGLIHYLAQRFPTVRFVHGFKLMCPEGKKILQNSGQFCPYPISLLCQMRSYRFKCMPRNPFLGLKLIQSAKRIGRTHKKRNNIVVASHFMKSVLMRNGFNGDKIHVIPYFTNVPDCPDEAVNCSEPLILCAGRIEKAKGIHHLVNALPHIHEKARLVVVGEGSELAGLQSLSRRLDVSSRIEFKGWLPNNELLGLYSKCALAVVPSVWPEPFGIVGIEAMAHARPVVAFDVGGISEWLKNGRNGFLVKPSDEKSLAEKINLLIDNPGIAKQLGKNGKHIAGKRFTANHHFDMLISVFQKAKEQFMGEQ